MRCRWQTWVAVLGLVWSVGSAQAQGMNKCTSPEGKITYQDDSCNTSKAEKADIPHYRAPPPKGSTAAVPAAAPVAAPVAVASNTKAKTKGIPEDAVVHTGPRGGRYIILPSGKKRYLPKEEP